MDNKSLKVYIILIIIVIAIVLVITYIKGNGNGGGDIQCIADNSLLIVKEGCSACAYQKNLFKDDLDKFEIIDCAYETQKCAELGIEHIPTWIINEEKYEGAHSIEQLKQLTGC